MLCFDVQKSDFRDKAASVNGWSLILV